MEQAESVFNLSIKETLMAAIIQMSYSETHLKKKRVNLTRLREILIIEVLTLS